MTEPSTQDVSTSPDAAAATLGQPVRVITAPALTAHDVGAYVRIANGMVELTGTITMRGDTTLTMEPADREAWPNGFTTSIDPATVVYVLREAPKSEQAEPINLDLIRELAEISDKLARHEGIIKDLKARKAVISEELVGAFQLHGVRRLTVDDRPAHLHVKTYARLRERPEEEGGGRYGREDVVAAMRAIGREGNIKPEEVNPQTLSAVLREYRNAKQPVPEPLAKVVELHEDPEVRVGKAAT